RCPLRTGACKMREADTLSRVRVSGSHPFSCPVGMAEYVVHMLRVSAVFHRSAAIRSGGTYGPIPTNQDAAARGRTAPAQREIEAHLARRALGWLRNSGGRG